MLKLGALHILGFYILFLIVLSPTAALLERGIGHVDNYDDTLADVLNDRGVEEREYEERSGTSGKGVLEIRAENIARAAADVEERDQHATGGHFSRNDRNDGSEWNKRGDMHATGERPDDNHDWLKNEKRMGGALWEGKLEKKWNGAPAEDMNDGQEWAKRGDAHATVEGPDDSHDWLMRPSSIGPFHESQPFPPSGRRLKLDKRGIIEEWMHPRAMEKRQLTCRDPGYVPCTNNPYCCPSQSNCCPLGCKNDASDVCCNGYSCDAGYQCDKNCGGCVKAGGGCCPDGRHTCSAGEQCCPDGCVTKGSTCCSGGGYCPAGKQCCEDGCAPEGSQCCTGGGSCGKGNICVINNRTGNKGCCTDLKCTAWISDGVTVPLVSTIDPKPQPAPETTPPPQTTQAPREQDVVVYYTYRFTITWWYWYYYYTYWAVRQVSTVTSSQETITTTVTVTNTATETSSLFESLSSSLVEEFTTPADATTALATPTIPANTAQDASTDDATETLATITEETTTTEQQPETTNKATTTTRSRSSTTSSPIFTGGSGSGSSGTVKVDWWFGYTMMGFAMGAGVGMVWL